MKPAHLFLFAILLPAPLLAQDSCVNCHSVMGGTLQAPATAFSSDVHQRAGFSCADCHGGDRNADDPTVAMGSAAGFRGKIARTAVPQLCARCHSDATLMHRFKPQERVDQFAQYQTSVHGKRIAAGDDAAAVCVDCHSVHDIRAVKDPVSPVYPERVPQTCARCHADPAHMAKYKIPTTQFDEYRASVHWEALSQRRDRSAPTCVSCHGNHGATPPEVSSVSAVCGTCHALLQDLYDQSPHKAAFAAMGQSGCVTCHGNHAITHPTSRLLAGEGAICSTCHTPDSGGGMAAVQMQQDIDGLSSSIARSQEILGRARLAGMEVSEPLRRVQDAEENLVKARVAVHNFRREAVGAPTQEGMTIAAETYLAGQEAMAEKDYRRKGLAVSLAAILITMLGLWLTIRSIETRRNADRSPF
jgi:nitrate/TMAO reductase-like tetraheme cytochrome c subunit